MCYNASMKNLTKNEIYEATFTGLTSEGLGVCRIDGRAVFVKGALPGEIWTVRITKVGRSAVFGRGELLLSPAPERTEPECPHFGRCGGCATMHMSYEAELRHKLERVNDAFRRIGGLSLVAEAIIPSQSIEGYRNKAVYAVGERNGEVISGFYRGGSHDIVATERCYLQNRSSDACANAVREWMNARQIPAYNPDTGRGAVRHVFTRTARDGSVVCCVVSADGFGVHTSKLVNCLRAACPELSGIVLNINKTQGNTVLAGDFYTLWGSDMLTDVLCGHSFNIAPQAFYQINPPQAERLYDLAVKFAAPSADRTVLDLYCGAGTISLCIAEKAGLVIGAEIVPQAIENARENAARNGMSNVEFICADAGEAAQELLRRGVTPEVVVVDPPRKGMSPDAVEAVAAMSPERVVYVSCDPATLARDLAIFKTLGYNSQRAIAVDMFPRTMHVETCVLLSHKNS